MKASEVVIVWNNAFLAGDQASFMGHMSKDFRFSGPVPEPIGPEAYAGLMNTMKAAMPDLNNHLQVTSETGDTVRGQVQLGGTHTHNLDLSPMGMPVFPATNKAVQLPVETFTAKIENGKITEFAVVVPENGGLKGLLAQIGANG